MKYFITLFFLFSFTISGCAFLRSGDDESQDKFYEETNEMENENLDSEKEIFTEEEEDEDKDIEDMDDEDIDEGEDEDEDEDIDEGEDEDIDEGEDEDEDEGEDEDIEDEEDQDEEDATENKTGLKSFFGRMFDFSEEEEAEDEFIVDEEGFVEGESDYEDYEEEDEEDEVEDEEDETYISEEAGSSSEDMANVKPSEEDISSSEDALAASKSLEQPASSSKVISLNKIIRIPYKKAGHLVNAVYIVRQGDSLSSISQKIYGSNRANALHQINPHLQSRSVTVGDKVYYNSPSRTQDSSQLLFYYQDIGAPSITHQLLPGDNIRYVAFQLLGHPKSWKEIWAINPELTSKGKITQNISVVYWTDSSAPVRTPEPDHPFVPENQEVQQEASLDMEPHMEEPMAPEEVLPPSPIVDETTILPKMNKMNDLKGLLKQKEVLAGLLGIIAILIFIIRIILRKRNQKDFDYTATNIEI